MTDPVRMIYRATPDVAIRAILMCLEDDKVAHVYDTLSDFGASEALDTLRAMRLPSVSMVRDSRGRMCITVHTVAGQEVIKATASAITASYDYAEVTIARGPDGEISAAEDYLRRIANAQYQLYGTEAEAEPEPTARGTTIDIWQTDTVWDAVDLWVATAPASVFRFELEEFSRINLRRRQPQNAAQTYLDLEGIGSRTRTIMAKRPETLREPGPNVGKSNRVATMTQTHPDGSTTTLAHDDTSGEITFVIYNATPYQLARIRAVQSAAAKSPNQTTASEASMNPTNPTNPETTPGPWSDFATQAGVLVAQDALLAAGTAVVDALIDRLAPADSWWSRVTSAPTVRTLRRWTRTDIGQRTVALIGAASVWAALSYGPGSSLRHAPKGRALAEAAIRADLLVLLHLGMREATMARVMTAASSVLTAAAPLLQLGESPDVPDAVPVERDVHGVWAVKESKILK